jgi:hypothetical protein
MIVAFALVVAIYFVPTMIAYTRKHERKGTILLVDLFLGWTLVGWWFALIWAIIGKREEVKPFYMHERSEPRL